MKQTNKQKCESCGLVKPHLRTAVVGGKYYKHICTSCIGGTNLNTMSAGYDRRRGYEDNQQDTIQPYDAAGNANVEFLRMYPEQAAKVFDKATIEQLKRKI
jgi:hypothetical protein